MWTDVEDKIPSEEALPESPAVLEIRAAILEELHELLSRHGIEPKEFSDAVRAASLDLSPNTERNETNLVEHHPSFVSLVLWRIFARSSGLWIEQRTETGIIVPPELMLTAYSIWGCAERLATKHGVDGAAAADALVRATYAIAGRLANGPHDRPAGEVRNLRKYVFAAFSYRIFRIVRDHLLCKIDFVDMQEWIEKQELSDEGAFIEAVEKNILCQEILTAIPIKAKGIAVSRFVSDYDWPEIAESLGITVNAAHKILRNGVRTAMGTCDRSIRPAASIMEMQNKSSLQITEGPSPIMTEART